METDQELIDAFATGIEEKKYTTVAMQGKRFVIFRVAGHKSWSGVGRPWEYAATQYIIIRKGEFWLAHGEQDWHMWQGRVSKLELAEALRLSEQHNKVYLG